MHILSEIWFNMLYLSLPAKLLIIFALVLAGFVVWSFVDKRSKHTARARHRSTYGNDAYSEDFFEMVSRFRDEVDYGVYFRRGNDTRYGYAPYLGNSMSLDEAYATVIR